MTLTEQDEYAEENSHQCSGAESGRAAQSLGVAHLHVSFSVAGTHAHRQRTCAAHRGGIAVRNQHGDQVRAFLRLPETCSSCVDTGSVVCGKQGRALSYGYDRAYECCMSGCKSAKSPGLEQILIVLYFLTLQS